MSDTRVFAGGMLAGLAAIVAAYWLYTKESISPLQGADGPGPNLMLTVAGQARGDIVIDLMPDIAPKNVERVIELARSGAYNNVSFHRVIDGFMVQTGDVQYGKITGDLSKAGQGGSKLPDVALEPSKVQFLRGVVGMARRAQPDSANSQFFIMLGAGQHLDGDYTVIGHVISGMEIVDRIKKGDPDLNGAVQDPDWIVSTRIN
ncbi:MAG: peptidylprolyl isomerase [Defluviimonas sp.]|uniref:peptidylprolyl isomerase n=1 Tax=Albidovulum sp. TaxID=1872424 RepID=UPI001D7D9EB6|nr:peptidylprolyl isomerase [Paracoccaceae bacterium]MCC0064060.1 peptidylprolyl isomerase [Defluviimonas sp.]